MAAAFLIVMSSGAYAQSCDSQDLVNELETLRKTHLLPGLSAAVMRDGATVWSEGFGVADVDERVPVTPDTPFWIASITKTFVGLTFLKLAADDMVDLDAPMQDLPEFEDFCTWLADTSLPFARGLECDGPITVRTLLTHTSNGDVGHQFLYNPLLYSRLARYAEWIASESIEVEGGTNELARQVEARILAPAAMERTVASQWDESKMRVVYDMARGYGVEGEGNSRRWVLRPPPKRALTAGAGIVSTALDLARYLAALDGNQIVSSEMKKRLLTPPTDRDGAPLPYAFGWYVQTYRGERVVWHGGWDEENGTSSLLVWLPDRAAGFAVLANGEGIHWGNPLDAATIESSDFARVFLDRLIGAAARERSCLRTID